MIFAAVMIPVVTIDGAVAQLDVPAKRTIVFSVVARISLVVPPLVLEALTATFDLARS